MMAHCWLRTICAALIVASLCVGCATRQRRATPPYLARSSGLVPLTPGDPESEPLDVELLRSISRQSHTANAPGTTCTAPRKLLALSGGGMYGAYSVGVLCGWSATGTRPTFDVVTGVSTGGLIATYAFLGPQYDRQIAVLYTTLKDRDIYRRRPISAVLWSDSAASAAPLKKLIASQVDDRVLHEVAAAHASGRRLYVGTTNLDTRQLVVWDMGAIASSGRPNAKELYRSILLASAAVPGFFPPVSIEVEVNGKTYTELHVDGGATTGLFLRASTLHVNAEALKAGQKPLTGSDAYIIVAGKLYSDPSITRRRTVQIGASGLQSLLYSQTRSELFRIFALCQLSGMNYHVAAIPEEMTIGSDAMTFDPIEMKKLYEAGYLAATGNVAWRDTPPGAEPHEQTRPRTGTQFLAPGRSP